MIDWSQCPDAESIPDRCSGQWVVKGTRVLVQGIIDNARDGFTAEELATQIFALPVETVRRILRAADREEDAAMMRWTDTPFLTMEAMQGMVDAQPWDAALDLPLPENPTLQLLDEARKQLLEYLDYASGGLAELCTDPYHVTLEINYAADRLTEIALKRAALILAERLQRGFSDAALDQHLAARGSNDP